MAVYIRSLGTPPGCFTSGEDRHLAKSVLGQEPFEENDVTREAFVANKLVTPSAVKRIELPPIRPAFMTSASRGLVDGCKAGTDRTQIDDVHENNVKEVPAGHGFEFGLCCCRPILVSARQVDAGDLGT